MGMSKGVLRCVDRRRDLSPPLGPSANVLASHRINKAQARAGRMGAGRACRIRQGTSAASGGSLPGEATISSNSGSQDAPEDGGAAIRKGGPPPSYVVGRRGRIQYKQKFEALPPRSFVASRHPAGAICLRRAEPEPLCHAAQAIPRAACRSRPIPPRLPSPRVRPWRRNT